MYMDNCLTGIIALMPLMFCLCFIDPTEFCIIRYYPVSSEIRKNHQFRFQISLYFEDRSREIKERTDKFLPETKTKE